MANGSASSAVLPPASLDEKAEFGDSLSEEKLDQKPELDVQSLGHDDKWATKYNDRGEPIINTGHDVSRHLISCRDDGDPSLTFRSCVLGCTLNILNSVLSALFSVKPTGAELTDIFNMLLLYGAGLLWAKLLPTGDSFQNPRLRKIFFFINPSKTFGLKEHVVSLLLTSVGYVGAWAVDPLIVAKLFFNTHFTPGAVLCSIISLCIVGLGLVGLLAPAIIYPSEMVYWTQIPIIHSVQALHYSKDDNSRRLRMFWMFLGGAFTWEIV